jgi:hypothetical protein
LRKRRSTISAQRQVRGYFSKKTWEICPIGALEQCDRQRWNRPAPKAPRYEFGASNRTAVWINCGRSRTLSLRLSCWLTLTTVL